MSICMHTYKYHVYMADMYIDPCISMCINICFLMSICLCMCKYMHMNIYMYIIFFHYLMNVINIVQRVSVHKHLTSTSAFFQSSSGIIILLFCHVLFFPHISATNAVRLSSDS